MSCGMRYEKSSMRNRLIKIRLRNTKKETKYVQAVKDYVVTSNDASLLSFHKNDIIKLTGPENVGGNIGRSESVHVGNNYVPQGWLRGTTLDNHRGGLFPIEYVRPLTRGGTDRRRSTTPPFGGNPPPPALAHSQPPAKFNECFGSIAEKETPTRMMRPNELATATIDHRASSSPPLPVVPTTPVSSPPVVNSNTTARAVAISHHPLVAERNEFESLQRSSNQDGHFSMMEFAMMNFKQSIDK